MKLKDNQIIAILGQIMIIGVVSYLVIGIFMTGLGAVRIHTVLVNDRTYQNILLGNVVNNHVVKTTSLGWFGSYFINFIDATITAPVTSAMKLNLIVVSIFKSLKWLVAAALISRILVSIYHGQSFTEKNAHRLLAAGITGIALSLFNFALLPGLITSLANDPMNAGGDGVLYVDSIVLNRVFDLNSDLIIWILLIVLSYLVRDHIKKADKKRLPEFKLLLGPKKSPLENNFSGRFFLVIF